MHCQALFLRRRKQTINAKQVYPSRACMMISFSLLWFRPQSVIAQLEQATFFTTAPSSSVFPKPAHKPKLFREGTFKRSTLRDLHKAVINCLYSALLQSSAKKQRWAFPLSIAFTTSRSPRERPSVRRLDLSCFMMAPSRVCAPSATSGSLSSSDIVFHKFDSCEL